jgi:hypothetical protein
MPPGGFEPPPQRLKGACAKPLRHGGLRRATLEPHSGRPRLDDGRAELRVCKKHGVTSFRLFKEGRGRSRWRCTRCSGEAVTRRHRKVKVTLVLEAGGACCVCGYDRCLFNLHFHHVDPAAKSFSLTVAMGKGIDRLRAEAKKCILVCANCHGEIETGLVACPPPGTTWRAP